MPMRYYAPFPGQSGDPFRAVAPHVLRIGDAERDVAAADLGEHYVAGRLTLDELHERLGAVFSAKTYGQLGRVMADLPYLRRPPGRAGLAALAGPTGVAGPARAAWTGYRPSASLPPGARRPATPSDRAGRFAALSLLILAMMIWLFTALLFAKHGVYHQMGPGRVGPGWGGG